jgi:hypothetical protein
VSKRWAKMTILVVREEELLHAAIELCVVVALSAQVDDQAMQTMLVVQEAGNLHTSEHDCLSLKGWAAYVVDIIPPELVNTLAGQALCCDSK